MSDIESKQCEFHKCRMLSSLALIFKFRSCSQAYSSTLLSTTCGTTAFAMTLSWQSQLFLRFTALSKVIGRSLKLTFLLELILFAVLLFLYSRGWMGGGDVKLLVAAFLWLGPSKASIFVAALTVFATLYGTAAKFMLVPAKYAGSQTKVPYAPSIALAWLLTIAVTAL